MMLGRHEEFDGEEVWEGPPDDVPRSVDGVQDDLDESEEEA